MAGDYKVKKSEHGEYTLSYDCPRCSAGLESPLDDAGKSDVCPICHLQFVVPGSKEGDNVRGGEELSLESESRACPFCGEQISAVATKCKHCGKFLSKTKPAEPTEPSEPAKRIKLPLLRTKAEKQDKPSNINAALGCGCLGVLILCIGSCVMSASSCLRSEVSDSSGRSGESGVSISGDGHDYLSLSAKERVELGNVIAARTGVNIGMYYTSFLTTFYREAQRDNNEENLNMKIVDAAAIAATMSRHK